MPHSVTFNTYCFKLAYCAFKDTRVLYIDWNFLVLKTDHMLNDRKLFPILRQSYMNMQYSTFSSTDGCGKEANEPHSYFSDFKFSKYVCTSTVVLSDYKQFSVLVCLFHRITTCKTSFLLLFIC